MGDKATTYLLVGGIVVVGIVLVMMMRSQQQKNQNNAALQSQQIAASLSLQQQQLANRSATSNALAGAIANVGSGFASLIGSWGGSNNALDAPSNYGDYNEPGLDGNVDYSFAGDASAF